VSYSHTQRRKTVRRFKEKFGGQKWYPKFREYTNRIVSEMAGPPIGTLEDILSAMNARRRGDHVIQG
jgi:hypothetical protein